MSRAFVEAVTSVVPTLALAQRRVLEALLFAPSHAASAGQLRTLLGLKAVIQVNATMGHFGRKVQAALGAHPEGLATGEHEWWHIVATGEHKEGIGFVWRLREEVVAGLQACGFTASGDPMPNEVAHADQLVEGAVRQVSVNAYERNPVARARCIEAYGAICVVCNFDFGAMYGSSASGFIHVHHIKALASIGTRYEVNPIEDLRPVCPNCHAVIHMATPARSIEEVKAMLSSSVATPNPPLQPTAYGGA